VEEEHGLAVGADLRFAGAEHAGTLSLELVAGGQDVVDGLRSTKLSMGEPSPSGAISSTLLLGRFTNTTVTPCSGCGSGSVSVAPRVSR
jgi:hypothetical protein